MAAEEGVAAARGATAGRAAGRHRAPAAKSARTAKTRQAAPASTGKHRTPEQSGIRGRASDEALSRSVQAGQAAPGVAAGAAALPSGGNRYQSAILAEFLVAALVVAFAPLASPPKDEKGGPSPYRVGDLGQLAAIGIAYFLLALWSGTGRGRMAAWFGFLLLLGILFKKTANGQLAAEFKPLTGKGQAEAAGDEFGGGDIGTQPPSGGPTGNFS